jgi:hypothetical protein
LTNGLCNIKIVPNAEKTIHHKIGNYLFKHYNNF